MMWIYKTQNFYNQYRLLIDIMNNIQPKFDYPIPYCYRRLIENCWDNDYTNRPGFSEIVKILETDRNFITSNVDENEYLDYIALVKENQQNWNITINNNKIIKTNKEIEKSSFTMKIIKDEEDIIDNKYFLNLEKYERKDIIGKSDLSKLYKFKNVETDQIFIGQMSMNKINKILKTEIDSLVIELEKNS